MADRTRERNHNWKGGRVVDGRGYVLLRRPDHARADCRGYVYEHVVVAEQALGRPLREGELVHHVNGVRGDNRPENLEVQASRHHHAVAHRRLVKGLRLPGQPNPDVGCDCGCGATFARYDGQGRPRRFVSGHNLREAAHG